MKKYLEEKKNCLKFDYKNLDTYFLSEVLLLRNVFMFFHGINSYLFNGIRKCSSDLRC